MIFVGSKVFTHARYWQIKLWGVTWGGGHREFGREFVGGTFPPPPVATPLAI